MYHFVATSAPEPLDLSEKVQIPGHIIQYLKDFQVETLRFLHRHLANRDFCILNDESGLGKCVATTVYLGAIAKNKNCLIVVQNDDDFVTGWQFHFEVLTKLSVGVLGSSILDPPPNIIIAKWSTLRSTVVGSKFNFDYIIVDNRGQMMNNNFCMSMLLSNYEHKVNLLISSIDVTADLKLLHNSLRLGGRLEHQYEQFKSFEAKYKLPDSKDVLNKTCDLEQYFLKREMISDYCKDFRLRRYRHQFEDELPLVDLDRYKISLELWHTISSSNSSQKSNDNTNNVNANSETATEELFNQALALDREILGIIDARQGQSLNSENNETSEDAIIMPPLLIDSESCSSDEAEEVVDLLNYPTIMPPSVEPDVYEFIDLSNDRGSEEYISTAKKEISHSEGKNDKCHSTPRSPTNKIDNQKTPDIITTQQINNTKDVIENQVNVKKTKFEYCKDTLDKKTPEEPEEGPSKSIINENSKNKNSAVARQIQNNSEKKQDKVSKTHDPVDIRPKSHEAKANTIERRESKRMERIYNGSNKKAKATDTGKELKPTRRRMIDQTKTDKETLSKKKLSSKDTNLQNEKNLSPRKRCEVKQPKTRDTETDNEKADTKNEKVAKSKQDVSETPKKRGRRAANEKVESNEISQNVVKSKQDVSETPTRRLRQLRCDKIIRTKDKYSASPCKANRSVSLASAASSKNTAKKERNSGNKSLSSSTPSVKDTNFAEYPRHAASDSVFR
ncbi:PREDICTED: protein suppressor of underreplication isoform X2 [Rhagoletis zephyria]|uniref:protein suppressor of underreplication isoform X2 n=1 Tax=Rhagoletis zephyria TaxID=28612 RepID=UPI00081120BD|nr:PREDICTED: protein suppressor of underreplication isoform X2 [Rhagoletis zephyria]